MILFGYGGANRILLLLIFVVRAALIQ